MAGRDRCPCIYETRTTAARSNWGTARATYILTGFRRAGCPRTTCRRRSPASSSTDPARTARSRTCLQRCKRGAGSRKRVTMSAGDVLLVVAATVLVLLVGVLAATLVALAGTLRDLRDTANALHDEALPLLIAARDAVNEAAQEVERVERLVSSAELVSGAL